MFYDQPNNDKFCQRIENMQYNAALAIPGAIKERPRKNSINNYDWNLLSSGVGLEDFVPYLKLNHLPYQSICLILFVKKTSFIILILQHSCLHIIAELIYSLENRFFLLQ